MEIKLKNKINLYDLLVLSNSDYDTYDEEYDCCITCCAIYEEPEDNYDKFYHKMCKKVDVINVNGESLIVDWSDLIKRNWDKFKKFTKEHWQNKYKNDDDEFIYQWINEIHYYFAGYVSEKFYETLCEFADTLE